ncbi:MAG TPA: hypothetical protein VM008_09640 [Phycisphaerae bacterium]|nr:hypothetical protein [Phycisphaerae bacterium]
MNFVKKNLIPLICGAVVLLFIGAYFWPIGSWQSALQSDMEARAAAVGQANGLISDITIPGGKTLPKATYDQKIIDAGMKAVKAMDDQSKELVTRAADQNRKGRVLSIPEYLLTNPHTQIVNGATEIPLLGGVAEPNYLPMMTNLVAAVPLRFKAHYVSLFNRWNIQLVGKDILAVPPSQTDLSNAYQNEQRAKQPAPGGMFGAAPNVGAADQADLLKYQRNQLAIRAGSIHMYVDPMALHRRAWWSGAAAPTEGQMFEALVDCWLQQDLVNAILDVNRGSSNVGTSPIKRLESVRVGVGPGGAQGGSTAGPFLTTASPGAPGTPTPTGPDYSRTMTGRVGNADYDVCLMEIVLDLDPAYQNRFLDALYRQNNGYTVLNIKTDIVDPFDAAGSGYLYGPTQVVHLDILVEGMLYRSWTTPIMPNDIRTMLGITALPPPGSTPAPGTPGAPVSP